MCNNTLLGAGGDGDLTSTFLDLDGLADPVCGGGVAIGVEGDVTVDIDDAFVEQIRFWDPDWERQELRPFDVVECDWNRFEMPLEKSVFGVAPSTGLTVEIIPVGECASGVYSDGSRPPIPIEADHLETPLPMT